MTSYPGHFIDRDPKGFDIVLNYLREGSIDTSFVTSPETIAAVSAHLHYLKLPLPPSLITNSKETQSDKKKEGTKPTSTTIEVGQVASDSVTGLSEGLKFSWSKDHCTENVEIRDKIATKVLSGGFDYNSAVLGDVANPYLLLSVKIISLSCFDMGRH